MLRLRETILIAVLFVVLVACLPAEAAKPKPPLYDLRPNAV